MVREGIIALAGSLPGLSSFAVGANCAWLVRASARGSHAVTRGISAATQVGISPADGYAGLRVPARLRESS
jgi:hypothetical protein